MVLNKMDYKLFAIVKDNIVKDAWMAKDYDEAQSDNLGATVIEMTLENSPMHIGQFIGKD